jgi:hypothetical protein
MWERPSFFLHESLIGEEALENGNELIENLMNCTSEDCDKTKNDCNRSEKAAKLPVKRRSFFFILVIFLL